jgi:hypothetical protein
MNYKINKEIYQRNIYNYSNLINLHTKYYGYFKHKD